MYRIISNADQFSKGLRRGLSRMTQALVQSFRASLIQINRSALDNLSGSNDAEPGSYPVPNRTGNLFRSQGWAFGATNNVGFVFNTASYAAKIHDDRPFLDDAVEANDLLFNTQDAVRRTLLS